MEGRGPVVRDLTGRLRGGDFREALKAVAKLRHLDRALGAHVISSITPGDERRAFQLLIARLVAEGGVHGLAARWSDLPSAQWRERLVSEIGRAVHCGLTKARSSCCSLLLMIRKSPDKLWDHSSNVCASVLTRSASK